MTTLDESMMPTKCGSLWQDTRSGFVRDLDKIVGRLAQSPFRSRLPLGAKNCTYLAAQFFRVLAGNWASRLVANNRNQIGTCADVLVGQ
jgi:hypothetical protein